MAKSQPIKCRMFFPNEDGGYTQYEDLTEEQKKEWSRKIVNRMGRVFNDYFGQHPEVYAKF